MAIEIVDFPKQNSENSGFSIAMLNYQRVNPPNWSKLYPDFAIRQLLISNQRSQHGQWRLLWAFGNQKSGRSPPSTHSTQVEAPAAPLASIEARRCAPHMASLQCGRQKRKCSHWQWCVWQYAVILLMAIKTDKVVPSQLCLLVYKP